MKSSSFLDHILFEVDTALRTLLPPKQRPHQRQNPATGLVEPLLNARDKKHTAGLMRVNHSGEVCAQALYQGQALTANLEHIKVQMSEAAAEEIDHLAWCETRLQELGEKPSFLNPLWYSGSFLLGAIAGLAGDRISLGFVAETERQVSLHLEEHLKKLNPEDNKSQLILKKMQEDEEEHGQNALKAGGILLPFPIRKVMHLVSKLMTKSSYYF